MHESKASIALAGFSVNQDQSTLDNFWKKVSKSGPIPAHMPHLGQCWVWKAALNTYGYASFAIKRVSITANRVSWVIHFGPIPEKMEACHHCDNRSCVNPDHLFLGTVKDNAHDKMRKGRCNAQRGESHYLKRDPSKIIKGDRCAHSKLKPNDILEIRELSSKGATRRYLGSIFGVNKSTIGEIVRGEIWRHI